MIATLPILIFAGLLLFAALSDITTMTIPNWVSITLAAAFVVLAPFYGVSFATIGVNLLLGFGALVLGFVLFQFRILGGGDAKLIAAAAIWVGLECLLPFAYMTAIAGGATSIILLMARARMLPHPYFPEFVNRLLKPGGGLPYGVAIAAGGFAALSALPFAANPLTLP